MESILKRGILPRGYASRAFLKALFFIGTHFFSSFLSSARFYINNDQVREIGKRIWQNECAGKVDGLTHWGDGEDFPSFGIGHFIWFPKNCTKCVFTEQFPSLREFLAQQGKYLPPYFQGACPWRTRKEFLAAFNSNLMQSLRMFLARTVDLQTQFIIERFKKAIPSMLSHVPIQRRSHVRQQLYRVARLPMGLYALIDYVNFKGEGIKTSARYRGCRWGLLQVLEQMHGSAVGSVVLEEFARSAKEVLEERVRNAPPLRNESRWLPGWKNRINTYLQ